MLGLLLIYFIGKTYHTLATEHNKERPWLWAVLGIISYYGGAFLLGIVIFLYLDLVGSNVDIENLNKGIEILLGLAGGLMGTVGLYQFLKYRWNNKSSVSETDDILDEDFLVMDSSIDFSNENYSGEDYLGDNK